MNLISLYFWTSVNDDGIIKKGLFLNNHGSGNCNTCRKRWWDLSCLTSFKMKRVLGLVHLRDLHALDNLFGMHTLVYALGDDGKVELVHRLMDILSKWESQAAFRLKLYNDHFSYVKQLAKYSRCFNAMPCFPKPIVFSDTNEVVTKTSSSDILCRRYNSLLIAKISQKSVSKPSLWFLNLKGQSIESEISHLLRAQVTATTQSTLCMM